MHRIITHAFQISFHLKRILLIKIGWLVGLNYGILTLVELLNDEDSLFSKNYMVTLA